MLSKHVEIGMRVKVHQKTARPIEGLAEWVDFVERMYGTEVKELVFSVETWYSDYKCWTLMHTTSGIYGTFNAKDFEPYTGE